jgi:DNA-binding IclR family transcriptional regulator
LKRGFQQRHLLAYTQGLVDQDYIVRSGDTSYRPGQRLVVREAAVRECLDLVEKLAAGMVADVQGFTP